MDGTLCTVATSQLTLNDERMLKPKSFLPSTRQSAQTDPGERYVVSCLSYLSSPGRNKRKLSPGTFPLAHTEVSGRQCKGKET